MFSPGLWAGIELNDESGRNDGSHGGIRYFSCKPKKGNTYSTCILCVIHINSSLPTLNKISVSP